jgi:hypothetical protein
VTLTAAPPSYSSVTGAETMGEPKLDSADDSIYDGIYDENHSLTGEISYSFRSSLIMGDLSPTFGLGGVYNQHRSLWHFLVRIPGSNNKRNDPLSTTCIPIPSRLTEFDGRPC